MVPGEIFLADVPAGADPAQVWLTSSVIRPADTVLAAAAEVLNAASRVTILAGAGCADAQEQFIDLAEALKAPVLHAFRGKEFVEYDNPYDVGMTGLIGFSSGCRAMEHCDALVILGTDFPHRQFYPDRVLVTQVDVRGEQIGRRVPVQVPLAGTVRDTVDALLPLITGQSYSAHLEVMTAHYKRARGRLDKLAGDGRNQSPLYPQYVAATIDRLAALDAIFTADAGTPCIWAARYPAYERHPLADRLVESRVHGQRAAAGHRGTGQPAGPSGHQPVRRRRARDAARGVSGADEFPVTRAGRRQRSQTARRPAGRLSLPRAARPVGHAGSGDGGGARRTVSWPTRARLTGRGSECSSWSPDHGSGGVDLDRRPGYRPGISRGQQDHPERDHYPMVKSQIHRRAQSWPNRLFMNVLAASSPSPP